jgi:hypothetical protein
LGGWTFQAGNQGGGTAITFRRALNRMAGGVDKTAGVNRRNFGQKKAACAGTKGRCCRAVTVGHDHCYGIASKQPN